MTGPEIDLSALAALFAELPPTAREGLVLGKTAFKNVVADHLKCSEAEAERIVDTMVMRGFLRLENVRGLELWTVTTPE